MREILFRGKRIDNGKWVEGFYFCMVHDDGRHIHHFIMPLGADLNLGTPIEKIQVEVDEKTICQFTGLLDKNGNKIWENDIVDTHNKGVGYSRLERVIYENGGFFPISTHGWECEPDADEIEVIGNVFDNAELLKE